MKRKLFTLLLAFVALATFQANAQKVWVHTGDSVSEWNTYGLLPTPAIDSKLTFVPGAGTTPGSFVYKAGETPSYSTYDKITVSNPAVNYVDFKYGEQTLELAYGGVTYNRFVVWIDNPLGFNIQSFNNGLFEGYLSVQTGSSVTDNDLLLVVHNAAGVLSLRPYSQVFASQAPGASVRYYPLYVRTYPLSGRWATAADFEGCKFNQFKYDGTALSVYEAAATSTGFGTKAYDVFTVSQVDWVKNPSEGVQSNNNIFGTTGFNATPDFAYAGRPTSSGNANYGTELVGTLHYIPLFTLSSPENSCKVLSVSRKNDLKTQNEGEGGYANKLELRTYNRFFDWRLAGSPATYQYAQRTPASGDFGTTSLSDAQRVATSLQKFAIWINDDGEFILYPAATYFWKYGEEKDAVNTTNQQPNKVVANAVLLYNDTKISAELGTTQDVRKSQGIQIGWYDGTSAGQPTKPGYIATIPNVLHTWTSYEARPFEIGCVAEDKDISGRFYFLQVYPDTTGTYALDRAAFYTTGGYQVAREYVLSVQLSADKLSKHLVAVPKEKVLTTEAEYWRFPYDSVNMAAHWEVQAVKDALGNIESYRFINMLGDTLQYDGAGAALSGGYLPENGLITGSVDPTEGPFGRPYDIIPNYTWAGAHKWFDKNLSNPTTTASKNEWVLHQLKSPYKFGSPERANAFYMQLKGQNLALQYNTAIWYHGDNSIGVGLGASKTTYYQKDVDLAPLPTGLQTYAWNTLPSCVGLLISLEPIYYVPTKEIYLGTNSDDGIINTGGKNASTGELIPSKFLKQDSLTAYTFLNGTFSIKEATAVDNSLVLGYTPNIPTYDGSRTANVARLISSTSAEKLQFIPIASTNRTQLLKQLATDAGIATLNEIDYLYGEYYKWYVVKSGNYYLTFDTVNLQATTNRGKVGLTFDATDLANALPVRLYQPLVGDKAQDNFLFQFYLPKYSYYPNATLPANRAGANKFPDIESATLSTPTSGWIPGGRGVVYATLGQQSNYIHATRAFNGLATGTRFTLALEGPPETCCPTEFIDPQWMGANRLLSLPLNNRIWVEKIPVDAWIANGAGSPVPAIVNNEVATKGTTLTHTYATSIKKWDIGDTQQWVRLSNNADGLTLGSAPGTTAATYTPIGSGTSPIPAATNFEDDLEVPLYYIQNEAGLYLTVTANNDMRDDAATNSDVNGIQLQWLPQYNYSASHGYNRRALQLFAISGCKGEEDGWYGKFIYLPLASFKTNYKTGKVDSTSYAITGGT
ncbi:MAG: hypothetical protein LBT25_06010, partial [Candidatus Symbiothrix sp.]|nr:hypothetical protein [Candidatus Symbiothrix sp.]